MSAPVTQHVKVRRLNSGANRNPTLGITLTSEVLTAAGVEAGELVEVQASPGKIVVRPVKVVRRASGK